MVTGKDYLRNMVEIEIASLVKIAQSDLQWQCSSISIKKAIKERDMKVTQCL